MTLGLARVTISTQRRRVDLALPEQVALAELLPDLLRHAGVGLADDGERHGGWVLRRADGAALFGGHGLHAQGVRDGEVLHLVPARAAWPAWEHDDIVETIADGARRRGAAWSGAHTRTGALGAAGVAVAIGLVALLRVGPAGPAVTVAALGVAASLTLAGLLVARFYAQPVAGATLVAFSLPYAFAAGSLLVTAGEGEPVGPLPGLGWVGAPEIVAGSAAVLLHGVFGIVGTGAGRPVFAAAVLAGVLGAGTAASAYALPAAGAAAVLATVLVCGIGLLPLAAIRLGRLPMPEIAVPPPAGSADESAGRADGGASESRPDRERVFAAVGRTEELLTGLLIGYATLSVAAAVVLVTDGLAGRLLAAACGLALLLRARLFVTVRQRLPLLAAGLSGLAAVALAALAPAGGAEAAAVAVGTSAVALAMTVTGITYAYRRPGPYVGRAADILDTALVVAVVPVACAVLGLYDQARALLS